MYDKDGNWCNNTSCYCGGVMVFTSWGQECDKCGHKWIPRQWPDWKRCKDCKWWEESKSRTIKHGIYIKSYAEDLICNIIPSGFDAEDGECCVAEKLKEIDFDAVWGSCKVAGSEYDGPEHLGSRMHALGSIWGTLMTTSDHFCGQWGKEGETKCE